jgi:glycosyltransferase involved in cell wall biosynthesis
MSIFFVGDTRTPFMRQDYEMLKEGYYTHLFDTGKHPYSKSTAVRYLIDCLKESWELWRSDVVWIWSAREHTLPFILMAKVCGVPSVVNVGGWEIYNHPEINHGNQLNVVRGYISRWIIRHADFIVIPSEAYIDSITKIAPDANVRVIPNFIEPLWEQPLPEKQSLAVTACCSDTARLIKGVDVFEKARCSGVRKLVLGNIPRAEYYNTLKTAKVYCQLSLEEMFGISLVEAMALGCVPVVSCRGALPGIVGNTGIVVPYGDIEATEKAIGEAMKMNGLFARSRATQFSKERKMDLVKKLFGSLP